MSSPLPSETANVATTTATTTTTYSVPITTGGSIVDYLPISAEIIMDVSVDSKELEQGIMIQKY